MRIQRLLLVALLCCVGTSTGCALLLSKSGLFGSQRAKAAKSDPSQTTGSSSPRSRKANGITDKEYVDCERQVTEKFVNGDFEWIDKEASQLRITKERLPGGYWRLRAFYDALEEPQNNEDASDGEWENHIKRLQQWTKERPQSITAMVALANSWKNYGVKARGTGYADTVTKKGWQLHDERLATASKVLAEAAKLEERCPHWYVVSLGVGIGQSWDRDAFERMFEAAVRFEPTYYYLYQAKAIYLLPRWYGEEGEWEQFAHEATLKFGGDQSDVIFFAIYSQLLTMHDLSFMNNRKQAGPRLLSGFRSIEKLYGGSPHRLNEACYFAFGSGDHRTALELFDRIGDAYDEKVWRSKTNFDVLRNGARITQKAKEEKATKTQSVSQTK